MLPDTPFFHLKKGNRHDAEKSLKWFRDSTYHVESELNIIQETIDKVNIIYFDVLITKLPIKYARCVLIVNILTKNTIKKISSKI